MRDVILSESEILVILECLHIKRGLFQKELNNLINKKSDYALDLKFDLELIESTLNKLKK